MKRKRGRKKVSSSKKRRKFFFFKSKLAPVALIFTILVFAILLNFVHTGNAVNVSVTGRQTFISDLFSNWNAGTLDANIAKYLFWFMVTVLIWSALSFARFPPNGIFQGLIAIPAGFLATAYLTPGEVFTVLQSYETLGIVLTFIVPFMLMLFFSAMFTSNQKIGTLSVPKIMFEVFLWLFFCVILGYKMISGIATGQVPFGLNLTMIIMVAVFFLSFLILIFNRHFRRWMYSLGNEIRRAEIESAAITAEESLRAARRAERGRR